MKTLYLVDFSNFSYKFKSTIKSVRNVNGVTVDISVLVGFMKMLKHFPYNDIIFVLDAYPDYNLRILPFYKGQRSKEPSEGVSCSKHEVLCFIQEYAKLLGKNVSIVAARGFEADQVISSIVWMAKGKVSETELLMKSAFDDFSPEKDRYLKRYLVDCTSEKLSELFADEILIGTTDSDMYQLTSIDGVYIDTSVSGKKINSNGSTPKAVDFNTPSVIPAYKAICGDISDNVPQVPLSLKGAQLKKFVSVNFKTSNDIYKLIHHYDKASPVIKSIIKEEHLPLINRNYKLTCLNFFTVPYKIQFNNWDLSQLSKYGLKF